jgi:hypothetical protein
VATATDTSGRFNWSHARPETKLSELTLSDLLETIGWAISQPRTGEPGPTGVARPIMHLLRQGEIRGEMGWKETQHWGEWRSNWWGVQKP